MTKVNGYKPRHYRHMYAKAAPLAHTTGRQSQQKNPTPEDFDNVTPIGAADIGEKALTSRVGSYRNLTGTVSRSGSTKGRKTRVSMNQLIHFSTPGRNVMSPPYTLMLKLKEGISTKEICRADVLEESLVHSFGHRLEQQGQLRLHTHQSGS